LEETKEEFRKKGLGVCAISYDSQEALKDFAKRRKITFPLLSDPESKIIRDFGILNTTVKPGEFGYGIPFPGTYAVDENGVVVSKFFEEQLRNRYSLGTVLTKAFGSTPPAERGEIKTDHLALTYYATASSAAIGNRITLIADIALKNKMHLYAPGVEGYKPVELKVTASPAFTLHSVEYPPSKTLHLPAIQETVPVYLGKTRISQDITISGQSQEVSKALDPERRLVIEGTFSYQACDDKVCYIPKTVPLRWIVKITELDTQRVPEPLQPEKKK
jgi:hypothetical protein